MTKSATGLVVVVTGANGFVGSHVVRALVEAGATVRAIVRRPGAVPVIDGIHEHVGDFQDPGFAAQVLNGADAAVTTAHPMWGDLASQHRTAVEDTPRFARVARDNDVVRIVHMSTAGVYLRPHSDLNIDEDSLIVGDDAGAYSVTKRDTDFALAEISGVTGFLVRPPAILGPGVTSEFNTVRPEALRDDPAKRRVNPDLGVSWVHVTDLALLIAGLATGHLPQSDTAASDTFGTWTAVNVATGRLTVREYAETVLGALGVEPNWTRGPVWTGEIVSERAREWGWTPAIGREQAFSELADNVRALSRSGT